MSKREEMNMLIQEYIDDGGEVTRLRYSDQKSCDKARRNGYHAENKGDSLRSKEMFERECARESTMIFNKIDRWKA